MTPQLSPLPTEALTPDSAWHMPLPYVLGSLAAMLGLIAVALLVLVCSYCRLAGFFDADDVSGDQEIDEKPANDIKPTTALTEQFVVVMAGDHNPTFLANPIARQVAVES